MPRIAVLILVALAACEGRHEGATFDDPLHAHGIRLPPREAGLPPAPPLPPSAQVFPVPPPPFSAGIFPCSRCHLGGDAAADPRPAFPHGKHRDREVACEDCHGQDPKVPGQDTCFECHDEPAKEIPAVRAYFEAVKGGDGGYAFPRRFLTRDVIANHAGHARAGVLCAQCHGEATDEAFARSKAVPWMASCVACHEERKVAARCETCHRDTREPMHGNVKLHHAPDHRCLDCHHPEDRDHLRLANGQKVPFGESYRLCGQCHGPNLRDWKAGLHGKRTGMWDGERQYLLCVHCHRDPHAPRFPEMAPLPPPARPEDIR
jgi:hypothetical protein